MSITEQKAIDYLQLTLTTGVGPQTLGRLLSHFQTATNVLLASPKSLLRSRAWALWSVGEYDRLSFVIWR